MTRSVPSSLAGQQVVGEACRSIAITSVPRDFAVVTVQPRSVDVVIPLADLEVAGAPSGYRLGCLRHFNCPSPSRLRAPVVAYKVLSVRFHFHTGFVS